MTKLSVILANFTFIETRLSEFLEFLPYTPENQNAVSPRLVPIILEACSLIDSVLRHSAGPSHGRADFKRLFDATHDQLALDKSVSIFLTPEVLFMSPFASCSVSAPSWWRAYNLLKHDRLNHFSEATFEKAVLAVCALHQVIARSRDFIPNMISSGWVYAGSPEFAELVCAQHIEIGAKPTKVMPVESKLFVTPLDSNFVEFKAGRPFLNSECAFSPRIAAMISAVECIEAGEYKDPRRGLGDAIR